MSDDVIDLEAEKKARRRAQTAAGRAAAKKSNYKPASGKPASGLPRMGPGWGGDAKGPGTSTPINEHPANAAHMTGEQRAFAARTNEEIRARALAKIDSLIDSDSEGLALNASIAALNRVEGLPVARQITAEAKGDEAWANTTDRDRAKAMALLIAKTRTA